MKVLIVSFWFPPSNVVGAIRVGKLARYLVRHGHELRVLTTDIAEDRSLPREIPRKYVYSKYRPRKDWLDLLWRYFGRRPESAVAGRAMASPGGGRRLSNPALNWIKRHYYALIHIPDMRRDWIKAVVPAGKRLIEEWKPDIIFGSAPPFTGLIVAGHLARRFNIPWVADFRDLWVGNPYYGFWEPGWRRPVDAILERLMVRDAAALVTVSPIRAQHLGRRHSKAAEVVYTGYAEEDFPQPALLEHHREVLTIRYTGSIYPGFRDPSALFAAIRLLGGTHRERVRVEFFGDSGDEVLVLAAHHSVRDHVIARSPVPYRCALKLQMEADILLLLQWGNKRDEGNLPGKIFEYFYARRPILLIGYEHGVAARLIRERAAGLVSNTPQVIRDQLEAWIEDKQAGRLKALDPSVSRGLSRDDQFRKLERIFADVLHRPPRISTLSNSARGDR